MMDAIRTWLNLTALAGLVLCCAVPPCRGDNPPTPGQPTGAQPAPAVSTTSELLPPPAQDRPPPFVLPPPPDYTINGQGWIGSPLLDRPEAAMPGFFVNAESSLVFPHFQNQLQGGQITLSQTSGVSPSSSVGLPPGAGMPITGDIVSLPSNHFNPTITPRIELGFRLPDGCGEIRLGYRFMDSTDSESVFLPGLGPANQNGRLDVQFVDLDYGTQQFSLGPDWEMRTAIGLRYSEVFFDSQAAFVNPVPVIGLYGTAPFTRLTEYEAMGNWYVGAHAIFEVGRKLWVPDLTLFGRVEGSGMYGRVHQTFKETFVEAPGITEIDVRNGVGCPLVAGQVGLSWDIPSLNHSRVMVGYQYEAWWQFGRGDNDLSFGTLDDQGLFLRAEFNF